MLAELIRDGHFARHLRRMRGIYAERRRALETALVQELGSPVRVVGDRAGMHLVILLPPKARDHEIATRAARFGISVIPLSSCYAGRPRRSGLVLGYSTTRLSEIPEAVRRTGGRARYRNRWVRTPRWQAENITREVMRRCT